MGKLALAAVGTVSFIHEVFAEGTLGLRGSGAEGRSDGGEGEEILMKLHFFSLGGGFGFGIKGGRLREIECWEGLVHWQVYNTINDYSHIRDF